MKSYFTLFFLFIMAAVSISNGHAGDKSACIYGSKIDEMIASYKSYLYLEDSAYKKLSDIADDARRRIAFLNMEREKLIREMTIRNIELNSSKIKSFVRKKAGQAQIGLAYTPGRIQ